jgi:hypothetical protein
VTTTGTRYEPSMAGFLARLLDVITRGAVAIDGTFTTERRSGADSDASEGSAQTSARDPAEPADTQEPREFPRNGASFR